MGRNLPRRQFILMCGAALASPAAVRAQRATGATRRIGVMMAVAEKDPEGEGRLHAFRSALEEAGWVDGKDVVIDAKWYRGSFDLAKASVRELIAGGAEIVVVNGTPGMDAMKDAGADVPIVFVVVSNPVGAGYVSNLSRPGGKITGFSTFEPEIVGKWVQILRQTSPDLKHISMLIDPKFTGFNSLWVALQEIAPKQGIVATPGFASEAKEIESAIEALSGREGPGLIVSPSPVNTVNRKRLIELAVKYRIPAIYPFRFYVRDGGLITYGFNATDQFRRAATYVSRVLRGENAGDLPVQAPSLFELGVNIKTAKAMGFTIPQALLIAADEIVE